MMQSCYQLFPIVFLQYLSRRKCGFREEFKEMLWNEETVGVLGIGLHFTDIKACIFKERKQSLQAYAWAYARPAAQAVIRNVRLKMCSKDRNEIKTEIKVALCSFMSAINFSSVLSVFIWSRLHDEANIKQTY